MISNIKLEVGCLLGENCRPCVETPNILPFKFIRPKILKQQIQFCQAIGYGGTTEKSSTQILTCPFLNGAYGIQQIECPLASLTVA